jgi:hypothetical protein
MREIEMRQCAEREGGSEKARGLRKEVDEMRETARGNTMNRGRCWEEGGGNWDRS